MLESREKRENEFKLKEEARLEREAKQKAKIIDADRVRRDD